MERASLVPRILILDKENAGFSKISSKTKGYTKKNDAYLYLLRSKRFRLVSEQSKTEERDFWFWPCEKWNESHFSRGRPGNSLLLRRLGFPKVEANDWRWTARDYGKGHPLSPSRLPLRAHFHRERERERERERRPGARQERKRLRHRLSHLLQAQEDPRSTPSNWLLSSQLGNESFRSFIRPINSQRHH